MILEQLKGTKLEPYIEQLTKTIRPYVSIKTTLVNNELPLWQSKFGGLPYLPKNEQYPLAKDGRPLMLLAQLNFAEIPHIENYPEKGILQFFIDGNSPDWLHGVDFDNPFNQDNFRVRYYETVQQDLEELVTVFDFLPTFSESPIGGNRFSLSFSKNEAPITCEDDAFERLIFTKNEDQKTQDQLHEAYHYFHNDQYPAPFHQIDGYPYFTQTDPRPYNNQPDLILLFQMDTDIHDNHEGIMWGDSGIGNFFIHPDDLKRKDFSRVFYNWDCC